MRIYLEKGGALNRNKEKRLLCSTLDRFSERLTLILLTSFYEVSSHPTYIRAKRLDLLKYVIGCS